MTSQQVVNGGGSMHTCQLFGTAVPLSRAYRQVTKNGIIDWNLMHHFKKCGKERQKEESGEGKGHQVYQHHLRDQRNRELSLPS